MSRQWLHPTDSSRATLRITVEEVTGNMTRKKHLRGSRHLRGTAEINFWGSERRKVGGKKRSKNRKWKGNVLWHGSQRTPAGKWYNAALLLISCRPTCKALVCHVSPQQLWLRSHTHRQASWASPLFQNTRLHTHARMPAHKCAHIRRRLNLSSSRAQFSI